MAVFEQNLGRLREIVERLERDDLPLEEAVALFKEGQSVARDCRQALEQAKVEIAVFQDGLLKDFRMEESGDDG